MACGGQKGEKIRWIYLITLYEVHWSYKSILSMWWVRVFIRTVTLIHERAKLISNIHWKKFRSKLCVCVTLKIQPQFNLLDSLCGTTKGRILNQWISRRSPEQPVKMPSRRRERSWKERKTNITPRRGSVEMTKTLSLLKLHFYISPG